MSVTDDIRAKLDIVEIVEPYATLQQSGRTYKARCPFHTERTPSFIVNPERQSWRCFGACATGGDMFSFVMRAENMEFGDALRTLAQKAGVELTPARERRASDKIGGVNEAAADYYQQILAHEEAGRIGREYLDGRGVGAAARERFRLGLSPSIRDGLARYLAMHELNVQDAIRAGLVRQADDGRAYDFFRNRLMFPISDRDGKIIGFGARALDDSNPKYINTAATEAFDKRNTLYALDMAMAEIRSSRTAVIVEGYMDAIAAHEHGFRNVVASMGTALTENQVSQLRSLAGDFVLALDPDAAGQEATLRSLESSWRVFRGVVSRRSPSSQSVLSQWTPPALKIAELPPGLDPDALIRTDPDRWRATVEGAQPLLDFVIPALVKRTDLSVPDSRARIARELVRLINELDDADQLGYLEMLSGELGVPVATLRASIGGRGGGSNRRWRRTNRAEDGADIEISSAILSAQSADPIEEYALALLVHHPHLLDEAREADPEMFRHTENRQLFTKMLVSPTIEELKEELDAALAGLFGRLEDMDGPSVAALGRHIAQAAFAECLARLELKLLRERQESLLQTAADELPPWDAEAPVMKVNQRILEIESMTASQSG